VDGQGNLALNRRAGNFLVDDEAAFVVVTVFVGVVKDCLETASLDGFVNMMNNKALELGCKQTNFSNPHGMPDETHITSAYDMALIGRAAIQNDKFRTIIATERYTVPPTNVQAEALYLRNSHKMLMPDTAYHDESVIGGKTGFTNAAWNTLVTFAERDGITLVCVVLKSSNPSHYLDTKALFDYSFENYSDLMAVHEEEAPTDDNEAKVTTEVADKASGSKLAAEELDLKEQDKAQESEAQESETQESSTNGSVAFWVAIGAVALLGVGYVGVAKFVKR
jgi:D-alanyl-D-alanine carboxypeptidase